MCARACVRAGEVPDHATPREGNVKNSRPQTDRVAKRERARSVVANLANKSSDKNNIIIIIKKEQILGRYELINKPVRMAAE